MTSAHRLRETSHKELIQTQNRRRHSFYFIHDLKSDAANLTPSFSGATHKLGDGVSGLGSVEDPVLPDGSLGVIPADGEAAGGGVEHPHVPGAGTGHCNHKCVFLKHVNTRGGDVSG